MTSQTETTATQRVPPFAIECLRRAVELGAGAGGDTARALRIVRGVLNIYPRFAPAWNALATLYFARREPLSGAVALGRCLELDPDHASANITAGELALRTGQLARARDHLERALRRPEDLSARRRARAVALHRRCTAH